VIYIRDFVRCYIIIGGGGEEGFVNNIRSVSVLIKETRFRAREGDWDNRVWPYLTFEEIWFLLPNLALISVISLTNYFQVNNYDWGIYVKFSNRAHSNQIMVKMNLES
jgi:hypothetical protein